MLLEKVVGKNEWKTGFWCVGGSMCGAIHLKRQGIIELYSGSGSSDVDSQGSGTVQASSTL